MDKKGLVTLVIRVLKSLLLFWRKKQDLDKKPKR